MIIHNEAEIQKPFWYPYRDYEEYLIEKILKEKKERKKWQINKGINIR